MVILKKKPSFTALFLTKFIYKVGKMNKKGKRKKNNLKSNFSEKSIFI
jgi:hypothetical protein